MDCKLPKLKETNPGETPACIKLKLGKKYWAAYFGASFNSFIQQKCGLCPNPTLQIWLSCLKSLNGFKNVLILINLSILNKTIQFTSERDGQSMFICLKIKFIAWPIPKPYTWLFCYCIHSRLLHWPILLKKIIELKINYKCYLYKSI